MNDTSGAAMIESLLKSCASSSGKIAPRLIETHVSWVILAGSHAWKIKKPVNFGFLDFSSLEKRRACCEAELRLNRRLAPDYYLGLATISRELDGFRFDGDGPVVEYAVKMKCFDPGQQLDSLLDEGKLSGEMLDGIADLIADFHLSRAAISHRRGGAARVCRPAKDNFLHIRKVFDSRLPSEFGQLQDWTKKACELLASRFDERRHDGWIRECHGDLHLGNMAWIDDSPLIFDCIEFNEDFRWIDVMSEVAFLVMDLNVRGESGLAWRFLNRYLERTGDYAGVDLLTFYLVYRAMVRAKIAVLRSSQLSEGEEKLGADQEFRRYLRLAHGFSQAINPRLVITHGVSGSGKSTYSAEAMEQAGFIRIRSDVERKRMFGIDRDGNATAPPREGIYSPEASRQTYQRLLELAEQLLDAGQRVLVDATFLKQDQRKAFLKLAVDRKLPFHILVLTATPEELERRVARRNDDVSDADLSVLAAQLASTEPLAENERRYAITIDTQVGRDPETWLAAIRGTEAP